MRYSRFKQQIEGTPIQPRASRTKKDGEKNTKRRKKGPEEGSMKSEDGLVQNEREAKKVKLEKDLDVKNEQGMEGASAIPMTFNGIRLGHPNSALIHYTPLPFQPVPSPVSAYTSPAEAIASATTAQTQPQPTPPPMDTVSMCDLQLSPETRALLNLPPQSPVPSFELTPVTFADTTEMAPRTLADMEGAGGFATYQSTFHGPVSGEGPVPQTPAMSVTMEAGHYTPFVKSEPVEG